MGFFKVPVPPRTAKKPEGAVVSPKEEPPKKEKGTCVSKDLRFLLTPVGL